ncbi:MAG: PEP-CTERM sorting domain-containing protein [Rhodanobacter sp.]
MSSKHLLRSIALVAGLTLSGTVLASTLNILWYTGGTEATGPGSYETNMDALAASAPGAPGGNTWNVTYWTGGAMPTGSFNALVIASPEGGWATYPDYAPLQTALGSVTFGDRLMLTGQDTDWHYQFGPGPTNFDGPKGFLLDSINWAGSGTGMGLVALGMDGMGTCGGVTLGLSGYAGDCKTTENVQIPSAYASFPINTDLTSGGLSNWGTSAHVGFTGLDSSKWTGINVDGSVDCTGDPTACRYVTIVSAATGGGGIGTPVPEPAQLGMFGLGALLIGLFAGLRRRYS